MGGPGSHQSSPLGDSKETKPHRAICAHRPDHFSDFFRRSVGRRTHFPSANATQGHGGGDEAPFFRGCEGIKGGDQLILDVLRELTETIPETAWLTEFRLTDKGIQLSGYAQSASELIPFLELSPLFEDVVFLSASTRDPRQGKERFHIGLKPVSLKASE